MLTDSELDEFEAQLNDYYHTHMANERQLQLVSERYDTILEDYRKLKSDYEEARESRERYKKLSRGQTCNSFVLLLVDGNGYIFEESLIKKGVEGGVDAAQSLEQHVQDCLKRLDGDAHHYRVMVRIYANLKGLSKSLNARGDQVGNSSRSLARFTSSFSRSQELFDFIDVGEDEDGVEFKIGEMFGLFIENSQCKHIFVAGCHDEAYMSLLAPYKNDVDRVTLIKGANFMPLFKTLSLRIEEFPSVFRSSPLVGDSGTNTSKAQTTTKDAQASLSGTPSGEKKYQAPTKGTNKLSDATHDAQNDGDTSMSIKKYQAPTKHTKKTDATNDTERDQQGTPSDTKKYQPPGRKTCLYFLASKCAYGDQCIHLHEGADGQDVRKDPHYQSKSVRLSITDGSSWRKVPSNSSVPDLPSTASSVVFEQSSLPKPRGNLIPINEDGLRIDTALPVVLPKDIAAFNLRASLKPFCKSFQLTGKCNRKKSKGCHLDHEKIGPDVLNVLKHNARDFPCSKRGACRQAVCDKAHVCLKRNCLLGLAGGGGCRLGIQLHDVNVEVAEWVHPENEMSSNVSEVDMSQPSSTNEMGHSRENSTNGGW